MRRIAIWDDDKDIVDIFRIFLGLHQYQILGCPSKNEFIKALAEGEPALVFFDVLLSGYDGRSICKELRQAGNDFPIILISASKHLLSDFKEYCANDILEKPFELEDVLTIVKKWVK